MNFPLLVLQKSIEESILQYIVNEEIIYDINYGELWSYSPSSGSNPYYNQTNSCPELSQNFQDLAQTSPWVLCVGLQILGVIAFQLVSEERNKGLVSSLRRLGLFESSLWGSWFVSFQIVLITGAALGVLVAVIVRPSSYVLQRLDLGVLFLLLWLGGMTTVCNGFFLASICTGQAMSSMLLFANFIIMIFTVAFTGLTNPLSTYQMAYTPDGSGNVIGECVMVSSLANSVYQRPNDASFVIARFVVFFLPWFHITQALEDVLSVLQYKHSRFTFNDIYGLHVMSLDGTTSSLFTSRWVSWSFGMMAASSLVYLLLAWFFGQVVPDTATGEGRSVESILLPPLLKTYLFGETMGVVYEGDVRGLEKSRSAEEKSIRAYKVSKTFKGTQALREVMFSVRRGELFVLLGHNGAGMCRLKEPLNDISHLAMYAMVCCGCVV